MVEEVRIVFDKSGDSFYILFNGAGVGREVSFTVPIGDFRSQDEHDEEKVARKASP